MGIDIDIVKKWASEKYPFFMNNEDMLIRLYKKEVLKEVVEENRQYYPAFTTTSELKDDVPVSLRVKFIESGKRISYQACKVCHKKNCMDSSHSGTEVVYIQNVDMGDEDGMIHSTLFLNDKNISIYENGFIFLVKGKKGKDKYGADSFKISGWEALNEEEATAFNDLYNFLVFNTVDKIVHLPKYETWLNGKPEKEKGLITRMEKYLITRKDKETLVPNIW